MTEQPVILITGASRGIGAHLARHYAERGAQVIGCGRGSSEFDHPLYTHLQADITDDASLAALFRAIKIAPGRLDVLINNAGIASMNPLALMPLSTARQIIETNFTATLACMQAALRLLKKSPAGRIVNLSTVAVPLRLEGEAVYAASKSAVETLTRIAAKEFGPFGVTVNAVGPSPIRTRLTESLPSDKLQRIIDSQALPQWAQPADVAHVVDFFLHPASRMITGQVLYLGGLG